MTTSTPADDLESIGPEPVEPETGEPETGEPEAAASSGTASGGPGGAGARIRAVVPWLLAVLALAVAAYAVWQWQQLAVHERAREDVVAATTRFLTELTTWDASDGMGDTRDALLELGTDNLAADVEALYGASDEMAELREIGARSTSTFEGVYVQRLDADRAETFAVLVQRVTTDLSPDVEVTVRYATVGLVRIDGAWKVDQLDLLVDTLGPDGQPRDTSITIPGQPDEDAEGPP